MASSTWRDVLANAAARRVGGKLYLRTLLARAPLFVSIVLGIAVAAQTADIALALSGEMTAGAAARTDAGMRARGAAKHGMAFADIVSAHLFGAAPPAMAAARAVSRSPLVLTGIIATNDPHDGFAIVGTSASRTHTVYVGSEAAPGTVLVEVHPLWVVLQRGGERLTLRLPRKDLVVASAGGNALQQRNDLPAPAAEPADDASAGGAFALPGPLDKPPTPNGGVLVSAFQLVSTSVGGQPGLRISGTGLNKKVLVSLGLKGGDVITQVNGIPVGARNAPDLIDAIQAGNATLTVVKNGEASSVTLDPSSVASAAELYHQADPDF